ncbi:MAG TPA: glycosyltransferase family 2 protein [Candidatus Dormibacteraeota bacterium]|nr:glycosyltransferase family 2 protein [Candidatus Dormibacteraeota bacterium]
MQKIAVVVPNWNGKDKLKACLDSLRAQTRPHQLIVVENGSTDGSLEYLREHYPDAFLVINASNLGFAGGVNSGIKVAMEQGCDYVALFNNDAVAKPDWLERLADSLEANDRLGAATCKLLSADGQKIDSTGDYYTVWGLPYPRGRGESDIDKYDEQTDIFAASGGASLYRVKMLEEIGLFDEDFFAYYEDVDLGFRAQLAGWKAAYVPGAVAYHQIGATSGKLKGFATYQTVKNLPWLFWKNVPPGRIFIKVLPRFLIVYVSIIASALRRGQIWPVAKGLGVYAFLLAKKMGARYYVQKSRQVPEDYIWSMLVHDLPPNARKLRHLRASWRRIRGKKS